jgi:hypothetical protein
MKILNNPQIWSHILGLGFQYIVMYQIEAMIICLIIKNSTH